MKLGKAQMLPPSHIEIAVEGSDVRAEERNERHYRNP
jgi:hypothetical protein